MKRMVTMELGKHPFTLDDLGFLQGAWTDALKAVSANFGNSIIYGCDLSVSAGTWHCSAGWINLFGDLYRVQAHDTGLAGSNTTPKADLYWKVQTLDLSPSPVIYQNLASKNVHKEDIAFLDTTSGGFGTPPYSAIGRAFDRLNKLHGGLINLNPLAIEITNSLGQGTTFEVNASGGVPSIRRFTDIQADGCFFFLKMNNEVRFIQNVSPFGDGYIATPSGYSYRFFAGEVAMFLVVGGKYVLVTDKNPDVVWGTVGVTPAFQNSYGAFGGYPVKYRRDGDMISLIGAFSKVGYVDGTVETVFHFPSTTYYPQNELRIPVRNFFGDTAGFIIIETSGDVKFVGTGSSGNVGVYMGTITFSRK